MIPVLNEKVLITIGRESGSGGRRVGVSVAEKLGIQCYDNQLIDVAANISGLAQNVISGHEEKTQRSFLYTLFSGSSYSSHTHIDNSMPLEQKVFLAEYNAVKEIAERESAVIVGRCSDYALYKNPALISVFVYCNREERVKHVMETYGYSEKEADAFVKKTDKERQSYYEFYTGKKWGDRQNYDLMIDRTKIGIDGAANIIVNFVKEKLHQDATN